MKAAWNVVDNWLTLYWTVLCYCHFLLLPSFLPFPNPYIFTLVLVTVMVLDYPKKWKVPCLPSPVPLGLGTGEERPQTCWVSPFKASPTWRALTSLIPLHSWITLVQSWNCTNIWWNLKIGHAISRLACNVWILRMCSVISRLCKFLDYIHSHI